MVLEAVEQTVRQDESKLKTKVKMHVGFVLTMALGSCLVPRTKIAEL